MASNSTGNRLPLGIVCLCFGAAALILSPTVNSEPASQSATRLLEASGFDAMLRLDAKRDVALGDAVPEAMPTEVRAEIVRNLDQTSKYAETRRKMADAISSRFDGARLDPHLRWWLSGSGQATSRAQIEVFRELSDPDSSGSARSRPAAVSAVQQLPFDLPLAAIAASSHDVRECLRMIASFRRDCSADQTSSVAGGPAARGRADSAQAIQLLSARLPTAEFAAFKAYLNSPGAREVTEALGAAYLQSQSGKAANAQRLIDDAVARYSRGKIGNEKDATLQRVVALVDEGESLEESRILLHMLRSVAPRDPRIPVELARVALKQAPARAAPPGIPLRVNPASLEDAQSWIDRAIALEPRRADTLVLAGHLAYLRLRFPESIALLEEARRIGTNNPWLGINLADSLWTLGKGKKIDSGYLRRAAQEYEAALSSKLNRQMRRQTTHSLAHLYVDLREFAKARVQFQQLISLSAGYDKSEALTEYSSFLFLQADDLDGAIAAGREATRLGNSGDEYSLFAEALLAKAGGLYLAGKPAEAARLVQEAQRAKPELAANYSMLARLPRTLPGVFALHEGKVIGDLSDSRGGLALLFASAHASAKDIERLIKWGADPDYVDAEEGTPLHSAILAKNLAAIRTLLASGADVSVKNEHDETPLQVAERSVRKSEPNGAEILAVVREASSRNPAAAAEGAPLRPGYRYRALKNIVAGNYGHDVAAGTQLTFVRFCNYTDPSLACLNFEDPANKGRVRDVPLAKEDLAKWQEWFEEIGAAPERTR